MLSSRSSKSSGDSQDRPPQLTKPLRGPFTGRQKEFVRGRDFPSLENLAPPFGDWVLYNNNIRFHSANDGLSPVNFRKQFYNAPPKKMKLVPPKSLAYSGVLPYCNGIAYARNRERSLSVYGCNDCIFAGMMIVHCRERTLFMRGCDYCTLQGA